MFGPANNTILLFILPFLSLTEKYFIFITPYLSFQTLLTFVPKDMIRKHIIQILYISCIISIGNF